jgi:hypothetical protein
MGKLFKVRDAEHVRGFLSRSLLSESPREQRACGKKSQEASARSHVYRFGLVLYSASVTSSSQAMSPRVTL